MSRRPRAGKKRKTDKLRLIAIVIGSAVVLAGIVGLLYPAVGGYINRKMQNRAVDEYRQQAAELTENNEADKLLRDAAAYNEWIYGRGSVKDLEESEMTRYAEMLGMFPTGIMGYLEIPAIGVSLPIYHGAEEAVLQKGIGHLPGSSLPVGGENTHMVLTGHSGIPASRLLTDLDRLKEGDLFTVTVLDSTAAYAVDEIKVVKPEDAEFQIETDEDRCTLITCVPIGVNTHRLLVRGSRTELTKPNEPTPGPGSALNAPQQQSGNVLPYILVIGAVVIFGAVLSVRIIKRHGRKG